tara:strand:+ start:3552 stop:4433 length:882 start_codon:yes stop_codon:yes gene_type:complete
VFHLNILIIHNPVAGRRRRRRLEKLLNLLESSGHSVRIMPTGRRGDARESARSARGIDVIVAAGGDGTVSEIIDGISARPSTEPAPAVAFLPMGTANVLAWELGLPRSPRGIVRMINQGKSLAFRPGVANGTRFVLMASAGLDARAVAAVKTRTKRLVGGLAYVTAAVSALYRPSPIFRVQVGGLEYEARTVIVTRAARYGGPFVLAPDAHLGGGSLHIVLMPSHGWLATVKYGLALVFGRLHHLPEVAVLEADSVDIRGIESEPVQVDGDLAVGIPLSVSVDNRTIPFLVPS